MTDFEKAIAALSSAPQWSDYAVRRNGRYLIGQLYLTLLDAPERLRSAHFDAMSESQITNNATAIGRRIDQLCGKILTDGVVGVENIFARAVYVLRYLDRAMSSANETASGSLAAYTYDNFYVVPVEKQANDRRPKVGDGIRRRGLRRHTVIPREIDGIVIDLEMHPLVYSKNLNAMRKVGVALFPDLPLEFSDVPGGFRASAISDPKRHNSYVKGHILAAHEEGCDVLVWPELTMPPDAVDIAAKYLAIKRLPKGIPSIVVAGTWHVQGDDGKTYNRCVVLDGHGRALSLQDKALPYFERGQPRAKPEAIEPANTIRLILTEREVIGILICLDFCYAGRAKLLEDLNLSLAIVPSMGGISTLDGHRAHARALKTVCGTSSVIVQQALHRNPELPEIAGYILTEPATGISRVTPDGIMSAEFTTFYMPKAKQERTKPL